MTGLLLRGTPFYQCRETDLHMLRWFFLVAGVAAFGLMIAHGSQVAIFTSFGVLFANFATFCLQYNGPVERAQSRIASQMARTQEHSDARHRLETARAIPNAADREQPRDLLTIVNYTSGAASVAFAVWGAVLWAQ